jgi:WD40 repeat protein
MAISPDSAMVLTGSGNKAELWSIHDCHLVGPPLPHQGVSAVAFSPDSTIIATGGEDQTVMLWSAPTGSPLGKPLIHQYPVTQVAFSPDGKSLLTAVSVRSRNDLGEARLWDARTGESLIGPLQHTGNISAIGFSPNGQTLLTASRDKTVQLWDACTGLPRGIAFSHSQEVSAARFSHDGKYVLTSSWDNAVRLWAVPSAAPEDCVANGALMSALEVLTGKRLNSNGEVRQLPFNEWMTSKVEVRCSVEEWQNSGGS